MTTETSIANAAATDTNASTDATETITEIPMRVLKVANCLSLSGRSTLGYGVGADDSNAIFLSLRSNTAAGMFSTNWIAFLDVAEALVHADKITSATLAPLYEGTSRNNAGFMLAVLRGEGLVCPFERHYIRQDFNPFLQHINELIAAGVDLGDADATAEASEAPEASDATDVAEADAVEVAAVPVAKRGRPSKRT